MKLIVIFSYLFLTSCSHMDKPNSSHKVTARETIDTFYKEYLGANSKIKKLKFSRSFQSLVNLNQKLCSIKHPKIKCGWGVDGDIYLNAQEYDRDLTYKKSGIKLVELKEGTVVVTLNVFPRHGRDYDREIVYKLIIEGHQWVLDDIITRKDQSSREYIVKENLRLRG